MKLPALGLLLMTALVTPLLPIVPARAEAAATISVRTSVVSEVADYAAEVLGDPWDFSNSTDVAGPNGIGGGLLTYAPSGTVQPSLLGSTASSQPWGKDGRLYPIDAARFSVLALRLWSSVDNAQGGISWARCSWAQTSCRGFQGFAMMAGWNTYRFNLVGGSAASAPARWGGQVVGLRLTGASGPTVKVDWARLIDGNGWQPGIVFDGTDNETTNEDVLYWDNDGDDSNNLDALPGWGVQLYSVGSRFQNSLDARTWPPGRYRLYVAPRTDPTHSLAATWFTIRARPRPVVLTPNAAQGADWATTVRHNPFDMAQATDYAVSHARVVASNGQWFVADNTSNDPSVYLPIKPFAGSTYHRLQVKVALIGAYGLANAPGGGCVGRILWTTAKGGPTAWQTTDDLVLYPGWNSVSLDMATSPSTSIVDPVLGSKRIGWAGQTITKLRFDPNEDPGKRRWYLDDIKVSTDPLAGKGRFDFQFSDQVGAAGTTAKVEALDAAGGVRLVADAVAVRPGTNTVSWYPAHDVPIGLYRFRVTVTNDAGSVTQTSTVPVKIIPA
jgi:hypothetical protein